MPTIPRYLPLILTWRYQYRQGRDILQYIVEQIITVRRSNFTQVSLVSPMPCSSSHYSNVQNFKVQSSNFTRVARYPRYLDTYRRYRPYRLLGLVLRLVNFEPNEIALGISGTAIVSSIVIPETVWLSSLQFQVSHNTNTEGMSSKWVTTAATAAKSGVYEYLRIISKRVKTVECRPELTNDSQVEALPYMAAMASGVVWSLSTAFTWQLATLISICSAPASNHHQPAIAPSPHQQCTHAADINNLLQTVLIIRDFIAACCLFRKRFKISHSCPSITPSPPKMPLPVVGDPCPPPSITWFFGPLCVHTVNSISVGSAVFAGLTLVTNRYTQTDAQTNCATCVTTGHIWCSALQSGLII